MEMTIGKSGLSTTRPSAQQGKDVVVKRLKQLTNMVLDDLVDRGSADPVPMRLRSAVKRSKSSLASRMQHSINDWSGHDRRHFKLCRRPRTATSCNAATAAIDAAIDERLS